MADAYLRDLATGRGAFVDAIRRGDATAAGAVYAEDAVLLPPAARPVTGREQICAFWDAGLTSGIAAVSLETREVRAEGAMACEVGLYTLRIEPSDAPPFVESGHYVHIHQRQPDGSWRRSVEIFTPGVAE